MGRELNNDQIYAMYKMENWWKHQPKQLFEVAGKAGTGKTYFILAFIEKIGLKLDEVLFVSYMGKAVSQMIRNGLPAKTIHATCYTYEKEVERDEKGHMIILPNGKPKMKYVQYLKEKIPKEIKLIVVDEGFTVPEQNAKDLMSFGIPVIALGDSNQLPPPFGRPFFLNNCDVELTQIMRQEEGNPIIYLANEILEGNELKSGIYGESAVIHKSQLTDFTLRHTDVILTSTNRLRGAINDLFRSTYLGYDDLSYPRYNEKIICRRNDWGRFLKTKHGELYLTNGTTGFVDYIDKRSFNGKSMVIDFRPDFGNKAFTNLKIDIEHLNAPLGQKSANDTSWIAPDVDVFEYAYALTTYSAQGSQWDNVVVLQEDNYHMTEANYIRQKYSAITRAAKTVTWVLPN